jgi:hypothetical protein
MLTNEFVAPLQTRLAIRFARTAAAAQKWLPLSLVPWVIAIAASDAKPNKLFACADTILSMGTATPALQLADAATMDVLLLETFQQ